MYDLFAKLMKNQVEGKPSLPTTDDLIRKDFLKALQALKYMGLVSASKQNTFLFKKHVFGKPQAAAMSVPDHLASSNKMQIN